MCKNFREKGTCKYGDKCLFAHGDHELTRRGSPSGDDSKTKPSAAPNEDKTESKVAENTTLDTTKLESSQNKTAEEEIEKEKDVII